MSEGDFLARQRAAVEELRGRVGMADIAQALRRIDDGSYEQCTKGESDDCTGEIARDRLGTFPLTNVCGHCFGETPRYRPKPPPSKPPRGHRSPPGERLSP